MIAIRTGEIRIYPQCCTSACCGKGECPSTCPRLPVLRAFQAWRDAGAAVKEDPIWCPSVWTATRDAKGGDA